MNVVPADLRAGMVTDLPGTGAGGWVAMLGLALLILGGASLLVAPEHERMATGLGRVTDPSRSTVATSDPFSATAAELESQFAREVSRTDLLTLLPARQQLETQLPDRVKRVTESWGVEVVEIEVSDIETRLTADLPRSVRQQTEAGER